MVCERRRDLGHTQAAVAEHAGITQPALSRIECGGGMPALAMLDRIAKAIGGFGDKAGEGVPVDVGEAQLGTGVRGLASGDDPHVLGF
ncbi:MAG: helix-turn-helix protein [Streptosporangiaceae bacterium]|jgi:transcriptional regulator with XRE-family HTH domain|nr:helix-turn-helix protein [Streptosporangiaceae bacterium]